MLFFRICDFLDFEVLRSQILLEMPDLQEKTSKQLIFSHFFYCFYKNDEKLVQLQPLEAFGSNKCSNFGQKLA